MELAESLNELFSDATALNAHQSAAKEAYHALSNGIVTNIWNLLDLHVFRWILS